MILLLLKKKISTTLLKTADLCLQHLFLFIILATMARRCYVHINNNILYF